MLQSVPLQFAIFRPLVFLIFTVTIALTTACSSQRKTSNYTSKKPTKTMRRTAWKYSSPTSQTARKKSARIEPVRKESTQSSIPSLPTGNEQARVTIQEARSFIGTPYRWGGTSRAGMDCSGLLVTAFRRSGIELPRTSAEQSETGRLVSLYEVTPGDLVFFALRGRQISHVGMITEVRGKKDVRFIHASSSLGVIESNLFSDYYQKNFVKARRPF
jgi:cell wall-associated NlpC family hydrolase